MKTSPATRILTAIAWVSLAPIAVGAMPAIASFTTLVAQTATRPVARVNPRRPIQIRVVNGGDAAIRCSLTQPASAERPVPPGQTVTFGSTQNSYLPLPIQFLVYPEDAALGLSVDVFASNNVVTVVVGEQLADASPGNIAMSIDTTGAIYLY